MPSLSEAMRPQIMRDAITKKRDSPPRPPAGAEVGTRRNTDPVMAAPCRAAGARGLLGLRRLVFILLKDVVNAYLQPHAVRKGGRGQREGRAYAPAFAHLFNLDELLLNPELILDNSSTPMIK
ncbi:hypothetical protein EVAR_69112_1 [Eumeta japonica]|uniref:Uncharacterized protein n=1 Tax=Eumeta variegata TaxID=151549 RepID=A0A4C1SK78_EUMVA|nr:hypothetical protein EVAR_69112_1 [Eumeta japonica]